MNAYTPPLLSRTFLSPEESLSSLLIRLSHANFYDSHRFLAELILTKAMTEKHTRDMIEWPLQVETYEKISTLTGIKILDLYTATLHRFAPLLTSLDVPNKFITFSDAGTVPLIAQKGLGRSGATRTEFSGQFCPECLKEQAYHQVPWMLVAISACLQHECLLVNKCQMCGKSVSVQSIVERRCKKCDADLRDAQTTQIKADQFGFGAQQTIQAWLMNKALPKSNIDRLPEQPVEALYRVISGLLFAAITLVNSASSYAHYIPGQPAIKIQKTNREGQRTLTPYQSYCLYATTFKGIINWPESFHSFLQAYDSLTPTATNGWVLAEMGNLRALWLEKYWQHPLFYFIQDALDQYVIKTRMPSPSLMRSRRYSVLVEKLVHIITVKKSARLLHTSESVIGRLLEIGCLHSYGFDEGHSFSSLPLREAEVLDLQRTWTEEISSEDVEKWLGLSYTVVTDMVKIGLLVAENKTVSNTTQHLVFRKEHISECLARILMRISLFPNNHEPTVTMSTLDSIGINPALMLKYVKDCKLNGYFPEYPSFNLNSIIFILSDVMAFSKEVSQTEDGLVKNEELAKRMDIKSRKSWKLIISRWIGAGLLSLKDEGYFDRREADAFVTKYITAKSTEKLFNLTSAQITKLIRGGQLKPISGPNRDGNLVCLFQYADIKNCL